MKRSDVFKSMYLRTQDLNGKELTLTIDTIELQEILQPNGGDSEEKPVVSFTDHSQLLILNATNWDTIEQAYGPESDDWHGRKITIYPTQTQFGNRRVACMRIKIPTPAREEVAAPASGEIPRPTDADAPPEEAADDIPF